MRGSNLGSHFAPYRYGPLYSVGGGPWKVLPGCKAERHNTIRAAKPSTQQRIDGVKACICPRGMEMRRRAGMKGPVPEREREKMLRAKVQSRLNGMQGHLAKRAAKLARNPLLDVGGAPWRLNPGCRSKSHNTLSAYRAGCRCPRAMELRRQENEAVKERRVAVKAQVAASGVKNAPGTPEYVANILGTMPNLPLAACRDGHGPAIMLAAIEAADTHTLKLERAVEFCENNCRNFMKCRNAVLRLEMPAGSWDGVYGGLTPQDRREIAAGKDVRS